MVQFVYFRLTLMRIVLQGGMRSGSLADLLVCIFLREGGILWSGPAGFAEWVVAAGNRWQMAKFVGFISTVNAHFNVRGPQIGEFWKFSSVYIY